ncbi:hypothetical protein K7X08_035873 [Anisodus acutangulus]|uniref:TATA-box-binding protein n=1 Tax=Anisodus acutangulus TaxID=402998 RepID=A0A9Q1L7T6_9SOLA|nr:hypothetical protein K7X08_035873 [Anisodus acutangulus]
MEAVLLPFYPSKHEPSILNHLRGEGTELCRGSFGNSLSTSQEKGLGQKRNGGSGIGGEPTSGSFQEPFWNSPYAAEHCLNGKLGLQVGPESYCTPSSKCRVQSKAFAVIMRIREPKTTVLIFASGKMCEFIYLRFALAPKVNNSQSWQPGNMLESFKRLVFQPSLRVLYRLAYAHGAFSSYEPELFLGLIYRMKQSKIVLLIFVSGKIVITGPKVRDETYTAFVNIYPVLTELRKYQ